MMSIRAGIPILGFVCLLACSGESQAGSKDKTGRGPSTGAALDTGSARAAIARLAAADTTVKWDSSSRVIGDVDCDGVADSAFIGRASTVVHVGLIRATAASPEILSFGVGGAAQDAVCSDKAALVVESLDYDPKDAVGKVAGFKRSTGCKGLNLGDGECDRIHMFWNSNTHHLDWWRA